MLYVVGVAKFATGHHHGNFGVLPPHHLLVTSTNPHSNPAMMFIIKPRLPIEFAIMVFPIIGGGS
eukprot:scaffold9236_cov39-Cyclotella_meneghiniana.AAC.1